MRLGEKYGAAHEERDLLEQQLNASKHAQALLTAELRLTKGMADAKSREAQDETLRRAAQEGRNKPLREALSKAQVGNGRHRKPRFRSALIPLMALDGRRSWRM